MGKIVNRESPGVAHAFAEFERAIEAEIRGESLYPDHTAFVATDILGCGENIKRCQGEGRPVLLVFPNGETELIAP